MTFVDLFAGIGGISLGLERAGHECVGQVEIDPYARKVLEKHWPGVPRIADVKDFHGSEFGPFDLLTGGYPCQPFSIAGRRGGDTDERHLWPEVHRVIRNVRPKHVLLENVPGHLSLGFGQVLGDLAESGYDAEWDCIPAAAVGAPHLRDRVFIVAHARGAGLGPIARSAFGDESEDERWTTHNNHQLGSDGEGRSAWDVAYADRDGRATAKRGHGQGVPSEHGNHTAQKHGRHVKQSWLGASSQWAVEPPVGRVADGVPNRVDRLRTLGNAVVPQVAEWIGRRLA